MLKVFLIGIDKMLFKKKSKEPKGSIDYQTDNAWKNEMDELQNIYDDTCEKFDFAEHDRKQKSWDSFKDDGSCAEIDIANQQARKKRRKHEFWFNEYTFEFSD